MSNMKNFLKFKTHDMTLDIRVTEQQYTRETGVYKPFRFAGLFSTLTAIALGAIAISNNHWIEFGDEWSGLWDGCYTTNKTLLVNKTTMLDRAACPVIPQWHQAVIGLLIFANGVGFMATILSICGICSSDLPRKLYYYHSSGEIFFVCALSATAALIVYPAYINMNPPDNHVYGFGYCIGWGCAFFFYTAAFCMILDDLIHTASKGCSWFGRRKGTQHI